MIGYSVTMILFKAAMNAQLTAMIKAIVETTTQGTGPLIGTTDPAFPSKRPTTGRSNLKILSDLKGVSNVEKKVIERLSARLRT